MESVKPLVTLITTTGGRPEAFELCRSFMKRQTYRGAVEWIIVVDDESINAVEPFNPSWNTKCIQSPKIWKPGINTQRYSLDTAIPHVVGEYILIIEDDDYYFPEHIETYVHLLQKFRVVGECNSKYYNLKYKCWKEMENFEHASLCQTGFRRSVLDTFELAVNSGELFIDIDFWKKVKAEKISNLMFSGADLCIGMKGLPGRTGIGVGHTPIGFKSDPTFTKLKQLVGRDADLYTGIKYD